MAMARGGLSRLLLSVQVLAALPRGEGGTCGCGDALLAEVADLRADTPPYLLNLGDPYPARQVLSGQKLRYSPSSPTCVEANATTAMGGTWRLKLDIAISKGPYRKEHRVILELPPTYPKELPRVRFGSKVASAYLTPAESAHSSLPTPELLAAFRAEARSKGEGGRLQLRDILAVLHKMLQEPLPSSSSSAWKRQASTFQQDTKVVQQYSKKRKHNHLFTVHGFRAAGQPEPLVAALREAMSNISGMERKEAVAHLLEVGVVQEVVPGMVYSFEVFTQEFCETLMQEIRNFYDTGLPARRPNSMNNYGIILNDIGLEPLIFAMQDAVIQPLASVLFPREGSELESHHAFTIRYRGGEDTHLDVHTDDSDVTFNVNIFGDYEGCPLVFCGIVGEPDHRHFRTAYQHRLGYAVMHSGRHRHGAEDITTGERMNLVVWSYSYNFRGSAASKKKHKRERAPPDARCVSYTHDRDFGRFKEYPPGKRQQFFGRGWCPQKGKEYAGFVPETPEVSYGRNSRGRQTRDDL